MSTFDVAWTGKWPRLCSGEWIIRKNGIDVSDKIPEHLRHIYMNTGGVYSRWAFRLRFTGSYDIEWNSYSSGLDREAWIAANPWINAICDTDDERSELFYKLSESDWRYDSCGGCSGCF